MSGKGGGATYVEAKVVVDAPALQAAGAAQRRASCRSLERLLRMTDPTAGQSVSDTPEPATLVDLPSLFHTLSPVSDPVSIEQQPAPNVVPGDGPPVNDPPRPLSLSFSGLLRSASKSRLPSGACTPLPPAEGQGASASFAGVPDDRPPLSSPHLPPAAAAATTAAAMSGPLPLLTPKVEPSTGTSGATSPMLPRVILSIPSSPLKGALTLSLSRSASVGDPPGTAPHSPELSTLPTLPALSEPGPLLRSVSSPVGPTGGMDVDPSGGAPLSPLLPGLAVTVKTEEGIQRAAPALESFGSETPPSQTPRKLSLSFTLPKAPSADALPVSSPPPLPPPPSSSLPAMGEERRPASATPGSPMSLASTAGRSGAGPQPGPSAPPASASDPSPVSSPAPRLILSLSSPVAATAPVAPGGAGSPSLGPIVAPPAVAAMSPGLEGHPMDGDDSDDFSDV
ncbi:hypothetical protein H696_03023 [Fonticula alba]|uniref:Uncharacterized protein n=1 Tax=Fonticula alba TaxID=691883 RepID=A0A058Z9R2_FONAL|nr:hypothetical protein H696_03023 [Fonticula alba]KCV70668.1 hypothetical protein H696_03023 [Fonticula alba]|eukprot:XP_009495184.1 hypothetical protein H696_03023 [Fonticula alba]